MVTIYYTDEGKKCVYSPTGVKPSEYQTPNLSPLKNRLTENNEKNVIENGVEAEYKMVTGKTEGDANKYLHKKFKKVATLEETSPPKARTSDDESSSGRYICPYCKMACAKPSVLQKHIRAHTNERPFPCLPCGFAFKTKSNLYKHCRSRSHSRKMDDGSSGDEEDSCKSDASASASNDSESTHKKVYKPRFHTETIYTEERRPELLLSIPPAGSISAQSTPSPFSGSSPSPEFLQRHISKLISDNQAIVDEVPWPLKTRYRDSPPHSPALRNGDTDGAQQSKLALALLKPQRATTPELEGPLNLTTKEPRKRSVSESIIRTPEGLLANDILKSHSTGYIGDREGEPIDLYSRLSTKPSLLYAESPQPQPVLSQNKDSMKIMLVSPGPLLGNTPLVDGLQKEIEVPLFKKRKLDLMELGISGDEMLKSPGGKSVHLFGGEVQIHDSTAGKTKTLRIESSRKESTYLEPSPQKKQEQQILRISKSGLHCVGGTLIQTSTSPKSPVQEKVVLPMKSTVVTPTISVPGLMAPLALNPLSNITAYNPLTLPKASPTNGGGLVTILHGGKPIPFVPGMPGPHTLLSAPVLLPKKPEKPPPSVIVTSLKRNKSPDLPSKVPHPPAIRVIESEERRPVEERRLTEERRTFEEKRTVDEIKSTSATKEIPSSGAIEVGERKFLRPTSLPLKPGTYTPKRQVSTPHLTLVSPETPRPRKSYGQLYLNGHAYTYLGLKCSTRTFFCTLNKPQPIYVSLVPDQYKVSMYSNWKISDSNPHPLGLDPRKAMSYYDSRSRNSTYTIANRNNEDLVTHSTYHLNKKDQPDSKFETDEKMLSPDGSIKKIKVCKGGFESNDDYTYVRGRAGRGRYVCEECGIRCKKPSMLKKHIRTHTDLRPYTCKHCAFSFKTKGNLTKHMRSKAHYKRCVELGISPVPTTCDEYPDDESGTGDDAKSLIPGDESEEDSDDEDEDDSDEESEVDEGEDGRAEAARSLLSLSEVTMETAHRKRIRAGLVPATARPSTYPYTLISTQQGLDPKLDKGGKSGDSWRGSSEVISSSDSRDQHSDSSMGSDCMVEPVRPIDLSSKTSPVRTPGVRTPVTPVIPPMGGQAHLLKTICSTTEKAPIHAGSGITEPGENPTLLQTYLTERAAHDSRIKQRQVCSDDVTIGGDMSSAKESALGVLALSMAGKPPSPKASPISGPPSNSGKGKAEFMPPASSVSFISSTEDGRSMCGVCNKVFNKPSQLRLHVNIHFFERPFRCESCAVSFRTKGHLQKHQRSLSHLNKVNMNSTFGTATSSNPRPFKCDDCKIAFRIHGHLAKHLRSKMHIMKLECLGKLPFGTYAELERSGMNMNDIDTTDCENSLESLQILAQKLYEKDPSKLGGWEPGNSAISIGDSSSEDEALLDQPQHKTDLPTSSLRAQSIDSDDSLR